MVLAICTFIGGIVAVMQIFAWYAEEGLVAQVDHRSNYLKSGDRLPLWVAREHHIFKKAFHIWSYKVFRVLYSGRPSPNNFLELAYLLAIPYLFLVFIALTFPSGMVTIFLGLVCYFG